LGCSDCLDVFVTTEKNPKGVTKYSIKRKMAKTRLNLLKIVREWEHYNREKELSLYINGEAAE